MKIDGLSPLNGSSSIPNHDDNSTGKTTANNNTAVKSIDATKLNLGGNGNKVDKEREKARKLAMQLISDAYSKDSNMAKIIDESKSTYDDITKECHEIRSKLSDIAKERAKCKENIGDDYTEEQYNKEMSNLDGIENEYKKTLMQRTRDMNSQKRVIRGLRLEQLKQHSMVDAQKSADEINKTANKSVMDLLVQDGVDKIEDRSENIEKKIEKARKEKAEKDKEDGLEDLYYLADDYNTSTQKNSEATSSSPQSSMDLIVAQLQLSSDDVKGLLINTEV